jgi:hypothetical protein
MDNDRTETTVSKNQTTSTVWMFEGNAKNIQVQGGQMILDIHISAGCLQRWRQLIDKSWKTRKDQFPLMQMWKDQEKYSKMTSENATSKRSPMCNIVRMPQSDFIHFPSREEMNHYVSDVLSGSRETTAVYRNSTLIHIRNTGSAGTDVNQTFHEIYVRNVLQFTSSQDDPLGITGRMNIKALKSDMVTSLDSQMST